MTCIQVKCKLQREFIKHIQVNDNKIYKEIMENLNSVNICQESNSAIKDEN